MLEGLDGFTMDGEGVWEPPFPEAEGLFCRTGEDERPTDGEGVYGFDNCRGDCAPEGEEGTLFLPSCEGALLPEREGTTGVEDVPFGALAPITPGWGFFVATDTPVS